MFGGFVQLVKSWFVCGKGTSSCGSRNRALIYHRLRRFAAYSRYLLCSGGLPPPSEVQSPSGVTRSIQQGRLGFLWRAGEEVNSITVAVASWIH